VETDLSKTGNRAAMKKLLKLSPRPTAVIAFNDYVALDAIQLSRQEGIIVNRDISFTSYANLPITSYLDDRPVASVEQFPYQQAEKATDILLKLINNKGDDTGVEKTVALESKIVFSEK
jgi:LacI family repressor for deo operon, udp, cdd, tsx, nupC, and nupG